MTDDATPPPRFERKELLDLYIYQSNLFWKLFAPVGVIELATFTGWYAVWSTGDQLLARLVLAAGSAVMLMQMALITRAGQHLSSYGALIAPFFENDPPKARWKLTGRNIGLLAPSLFVAMHIGLMIFAPRHAISKLPATAPIVVHVDCSSKQAKSGGPIVSRER